MWLIVRVCQAGSFLRKRGLLKHAMSKTSDSELKASEYVGEMGPRLAGKCAEEALHPGEAPSNRRHRLWQCGTEAPKVPELQLVLDAPRHGRPALLSTLRSQNSYCEWPSGQEPVRMVSPSCVSSGVPCCCSLARKTSMRPHGPEKCPGNRHRYAALKLPQLRYQALVLAFCFVTYHLAKMLALPYPGARPKFVQSCPNLRSRLPQLQPDWKSSCDRNHRMPI